MKKQVANNPYKSPWIGGFYFLLTVVIGFVFLTIYPRIISDIPDIRPAFTIMFLVFLMFPAITIGFYRTRYRIKNNILTSRSPFMFIKIRLGDIKKVEKIMVPVHLRVGAGFYCGFFYVPNLGWVRSIITNLRDAILITTKDKKYMITPSNPERFMRILKRKNPKS